ncbi:MAG: DUF309 domain-containing protein [Actinobacteria bacterium]|nr:DUF309 domain-containing protein [Actinomycetota bacterium]
MPESLEPAYERGLELIAAGEFFTAHEALEEAWRAADPSERDFFQGLVHVAVAWHHAAVTGRPVACERQLAKATRRLAPYAPAHRGLEVSTLLASVAEASGRFPDLPTPRLRRLPAPG